MPADGDQTRTSREKNPRERGGQVGGASTPRWVRYSRGMALVFEFTGTIAAGAILGYVLDSKLHTEPWLLIVLTVAGVIGGFVRLVQIVQRLEHGRD